MTFQPLILLFFRTRSYFTRRSGQPHYWQATWGLGHEAVIWSMLKWQRHRKLGSIDCLKYRDRFCHPCKYLGGTFRFWILLREAYWDNPLWIWAKGGKFLLPRQYSQDQWLWLPTRKCCSPMGSQLFLTMTLSLSYESLAVDGVAMAMSLKCLLKYYD